MKLIKISAIMIAAGLFFAFASSGLVADETSDPGKDLFLAKKCDACHSVESQGITAKKKQDKVPDIGTLNLHGQHDFMVQYLKKEVDLHGKKHPVKFSGKDEELETLVNWMVNLTPAPEGEAE